ncbi:glycosyl hydrolase, partial [bacterium]|nr:glycosyl hydrolase [bacterium]
VEAIVTRYPEIEYWNVDNETNVAGLWIGTPEEYAENVIIPAAKIIHDHGAKIVAPGITIQRFESPQHYARAKDHMMRILAIARNYIDVISIHSYGKSAYRVIEQIKSFVKEIGIQHTELWITESGFPETWYWTPEDWEDSIRDLFKTGQQRQLERVKEFLAFIESTPWIKRTYYWRGFDVNPNEASDHSTNGLLDWRLTQKLAGKYVKDQLMEDRI